MTWDDQTAVLIGLLKRFPVLVIDTEAARRTGDHMACDYARAIEAWRIEATEAIIRAREISLSRGRHAVPDAFARIAAASALMRVPAAG